MPDFVFPKKRSNPPVKRTVSRGFPDGLNTLAHPSMLKDTEVSELLNAIYSQYGTLSKRAGTTRLGGTLGGSNIRQMFPAYGIGGVDYLLGISSSGILKYFNFTTSTWTNFPATAPVGYVGTNPSFAGNILTFNMTTHLNIVQAYGKLYFSNAVNDMVWFDGTETVPKWHIYTALADPSVKATVAKTGTGTGTASYYYRYINYNEAGGTLASPAWETGDAAGTGFYNTMPKTLDTTTYLTVTIPAAPAGTTRRAIFRGDTYGNEFYLADLSATETTYVDQGQDVENILFGTPTDNTTKSYHFYLLDVYRDTLVGTTVEFGKSVLVWGGSRDKIGNFGLPDGAGFDGWYNGDGEDIAALKTYTASNEDGLYAFKYSRIGVLKFNEDGGSVRDVNSFVGSISPFSPHTAGNNLRFWSPEGAASLGNEANYGSVLRYSVLSIKADTLAKRVLPANIPGVCSAFYNHLSLFGISTAVSGQNDSILVFDERYNAWALWTGVYPKMFTTFRVNNEPKLFYGSSKDPYVVQMFSGKTDYGTTGSNGTKVVFSMSTKQYDANSPDTFKKFKRATMVFGDLVGTSTKIYLSYMDENGSFTQSPYTISAGTTSGGFGSDMWGTINIGTMTTSSSASSLNIRYIDLGQKDMFWTKFNIVNDGDNDVMSLIGLYIYYSESNRQLPFEAQLLQQ